jgi:hypothetical protein
MYICRHQTSTARRADGLGVFPPAPHRTRLTSPSAARLSVSCDCRPSCTFTAHTSQAPSDSAPAGSSIRRHVHTRLRCPGAQVRSPAQGRPAWTRTPALCFSIASDACTLPRAACLLPCPMSPNASVAASHQLQPDACMSCLPSISAPSPLAPADAAGSWANRIPPLVRPPALESRPHWSLPRPNKIALEGAKPPQLST